MDKLSWIKRLLVYFFPRFGPKSTWAQAVIVTDTTRFETMYNDMVQRIAAVRPDAIQSPLLRATLRIHPGYFPAPDENGWGKVMAPNVLDPFGTIVVREYFQHADKVWQHEMAHCITGIGDHPAWLFKSDGFTLNV